MKELVLPFKKNKLGIDVMSSVDLAKLCVGDAKNAHGHFLAKAEKVLGAMLPNFREDEKYAKGVRKILLLPEREACLMAMSYSYELQAAVYDEWQRLRSGGHMLPTTYKEALVALVAEVEAKEQALLERDEAIRTKAQISDKKTASALGKLSGANRKIKKLEVENEDLKERIGAVETYQTLITAGIESLIDIDGRRRSVAHLMKKISEELGLEIKKVKDARYGEVNAYHIDVIAQFRLEFE